MVSKGYKHKLLAECQYFRSLQFLHMPSVHQLIILHVMTGNNCMNIGTKIGHHIATVIYQTDLMLISSYMLSYGV